MLIYHTIIPPVKNPQQVDSVAMRLSSGVLFCQGISPHIKSHKCREIFEPSKCVLVARDINEGEVDLGAKMESSDGSDNIHMWVGAWDMFVKLLCLMQGTLVVTSNGDTSRENLMLLTEKLQCHQESMDTLQFHSIHIN